MDSKTENKLKERATPILEKGRPGDVEHTLRVLDIGKYLLKHEKGDEDVVVPAIYLHDLGYSKVDFMGFRADIHENREHPRWDEKNPPKGPPRMEKIKFFRQHMEEGAILAKEILEDLDYPEDLTERVVSIVAVHDYQEKVFAMNDDSALVLFEADHLDRLHPDGYKRIKDFRRRMGPPPPVNRPFSDTRAMYKHMIRHWFQTETAMKQAEEWLEVMEV